MASTVSYHVDDGVLSFFPGHQIFYLPASASASASAPAPSSSSSFCSFAPDEDHPSGVSSSPPSSHQTSSSPSSTPLTRKLAYTTCGYTEREEEEEEEGEGEEGRFQGGNQHHPHHEKKEKRKGIKQLLCFHGIMGVGDFSWWDAELKKRKYQVLAPSLPGWGLSDPVENRRLVDYWKDIEPLVNQVWGPTATFEVLGISFGGVHAIACAAGMPTRVTRVAILSGHAPFTDPYFNPYSAMPITTSWFMYRIPQIFPSFSRWGADLFRGKLLKDPVTFSVDTVNNMSPKEKQQLEQLGTVLSNKFKQNLGTHAANSLRLGVYGLSPDSGLVLTTPWGFKITDVVCPVLIAGCEQDKLVPWAMQKYLYDHLTFGKNTEEVKRRYRLLCYPEGGHMTTSFLFPQILDEFLTLEPLSV